MRRFDKNFYAGLVAMTLVALYCNYGAGFGDKPSWAYVITGYFFGALAMELYSRAIKHFSQEGRGMRLRPIALRLLGAQLQSVDYFNTSASGAIGVDAARRRIAILPNFSSAAYVVDAHLILSYSAISDEQSGVYFEIDNLDRPTLFAPMSGSDAERWRLVLHKLLNGTLEPVERPRHYP